MNCGCTEAEFPRENETSIDSILNERAKARSEPMLFDDELLNPPAASVSSFERAAAETLRQVADALHQDFATSLQGTSAAAAAAAGAAVTEQLAALHSEVNALKGITNGGFTRVLAHFDERPRSITPAHCCQPDSSCLEITAWNRTPTKEVAASPRHGGTIPQTGNLSIVSGGSPSINTGGSARSSTQTSLSPKDDKVSLACMRASSVKQKVQELTFSQGRHASNVNQKYYKNGFFQRVAKSPMFENSVLIVVVANALWISVDLDLNPYATLVNAHPIFQVAESFFCSFFVGELFIRFMAIREKKRVLLEWWFVFDLILVVMYVFDTIVMSFVAILGLGNKDHDLGNASVLRLLRLLRLTRMARMMRAVPELMVMVKGLVAGLRSVMITFVLLMIVTYIFAIIFRQLTFGSDVGDSYFQSVPYAVYTLLIQGMLPDNLGLMEALRKDNWYIVIVFFLFLFFTALTFMNMLIGILCDVVSGVAGEEKFNAEMEHMRSKLQHVLNDIDENYDGFISKVEFEGILEHVEAIKALMRVGVDVIVLVEDADYIFNDKQQLTFEELIEEFLQYRATSSTTLRSISTIRKLLRSHTLHMHEWMARFDLGVIDEKFNRGANSHEKFHRASSKVVMLLDAETPPGEKAAALGAETSAETLVSKSFQI